jgi:hypothetical protein
MVEVVEAAKITVITPGATETVLTVSSLPSLITSTAICDFIRAKAGSDTIGLDKVPTAVQTTAPFTITFNNTDIPAELSVGDYVTLSEETPVPQVPVEWVSYMAYWVANNLLEELGDTEGAAVIARRLKRLETKALSLISPRVECKSKAVLKPYVSKRNRYW